MSRKYTIINRLCGFGVVGLLIMGLVGLLLPVYINAKYQPLKQFAQAGPFSVNAVPSALLVKRFDTPPGNYNIDISGYTPGTVPAWDINGDHICDITDLSAIGLHWFEEGIPGWIPEDVIPDGIIDISDLVEIGLHWFETWL
jgi:hypothetical protein